MGQEFAPFDSMQVISMVPSLTETLIECGVNVLGRTRFCIHPREKVASIPVVGGTKDIQWEKVKSLAPDLIILDQEENPKEFYDQSPVPCLVTHVRDLTSLAVDLEKLAVSLQSQKLSELAEKARELSERKRSWKWSNIPGELECLRRDYSSYEELVYVIWKNPWMQVSRDTFIGSMLEQWGWELKTTPAKYPEFKLEDYDLKKTYFLFSSEPFPFHKKKSDLLEIAGLQGSIVDGESYSWFGIRSLRALGEESLG